MNNKLIKFVKERLEDEEEREDKYYMSVRKVERGGRERGEE